MSEPKGKHVLAIITLFRGPDGGPAIDSRNVGEMTVAEQSTAILLFQRLVKDMTDRFFDDTVKSRVAPELTDEQKSAVKEQLETAARLNDILRG